MNRIFKSLWSVARQCWCAVPEIAASAGKGRSGQAVASSSAGMLASVALSLSMGGHALAQAPPAPTQLPTGGRLVAGQATISQTSTAQAASLLVQQSSPKAILQWDSFNLGSAAQVQFAQPNAQAVTLNRINDANPSQIFGRISAPGQVVLTNAQGLYFSPTSTVDVGSLIATTHSIANEDFLAGNYRFARNGATGKLVNEGQLKAALGGYIALLAPEVRNAGVVLAQAGTVALAAGELITLNLLGQGTLANISTTPSTLAALVENKQAVLAPDGQIILSAVALQTLQAGVIRNSGSLQANSLVNKGGKIVLEGDDIQLASTSHIQATGPKGGGTVLVGGDWQGSGDMRQATKLRMQSGASIDASATDQGDGGKVVLWSDVHNPQGMTQVDGRITAEAGPQGGNGGRVETSGHQLMVNELQVSTRAPKGAFGEWLLDPYDLTISSAATSGTTGSYTATADSSVVNVTALQTALASSGITISTGAGGTQSGDITLAAPLSWTSGSNLVLNAAGSIVLNSNIAWSTNAGTAWVATAGGLKGSGNIAMTGTAGNFSISQDAASTYAGNITGAGKLTKLGTGSLTLTGNNTYTLGTVLGAGTLSLGSSTAIGSTGKLIFSGGTLQFTSANTTDSPPGLTTPRPAKVSTLIPTDKTSPWQPC